MEPAKKAADPTRPRFESPNLGFPAALGAACAAILGQYYDIDQASVALITLVGVALGRSLDQWWQFGMALGFLWREAFLERKLMKYEKEFGVKPGSTSVHMTDEGHI